jgi:hypothetical protein
MEDDLLEKVFVNIVEQQQRAQITHTDFTSQVIKCEEEAESLAIAATENDSRSLETRIKTLQAEISELLKQLDAKSDATLIIRLNNVQKYLLDNFDKTITPYDLD